MVALGQRLDQHERGLGRRDVVPGAHLHPQHPGVGADHRALDHQAAAVAHPHRLADVDLALVLHEQARQPFSKVDVPRSGTVAVVVGPEGGLTDTEVARLTAAGATAVRLGGSVLRTSTAGAAAAAVVSARTARWA